MILASIQNLLFLFFLSKTCHGQPRDDDDLLLSKMSVFPSTKNESREIINLMFERKRMLADGDFDDRFENRKVKFTILDEKEKMKEEMSIVFDDNLMKTINDNGQFMGLTEWVKSRNGKYIRVEGYFNKNAHEKFFLLEEMRNNKLIQLNRSKITFEETVKVKLFMKTVLNEKVDEVHVGSIITIFCKPLNKKKGQPKFEHGEVRQKTLEFDEQTKESRLIFQAEKENHLKTIWCVVDKTRRSLTIKVFHAPADVRIKPTERDPLMAGGHLRCFAVDGYPLPTVTWLTASVPPKRDKFYRIDQTTNSSSTFILKDDVPVGSTWSITCRSSNPFGNFSLTVNFTVAANQTWLLSKRLSDIEVKLQQLQDVVGKLTKANDAQRFENMQKILVQRLSNLETKMENIFEKLQKKFQGLQKNVIQQQSNLKTKMEMRMNLQCSVRFQILQNVNTISMIGTPSVLNVMNPGQAGVVLYDNLNNPVIVYGTYQKARAVALPKHEFGKYFMQYTGWNLTDLSFYNNAVRWLTHGACVDFTVCCFYIENFGSYLNRDGLVAVYLAGTTFSYNDTGLWNKLTSGSWGIIFSGTFWAGGSNQQPQQLNMMKMFGFGATPVYAHANTFTNINGCETSIPSRTNTTKSCL